MYTYYKSQNNGVTLSDILFIKSIYLSIYLDSNPILGLAE